MARWLRHKMQELKIPTASYQPVFQWAANFEGPGFVQITEDEFKARLPQVIYLLLHKSQWYFCRILLLFENLKKKLVKWQGNVNVTFVI